MPRKTNSNNPADWLHISACDLEGIRLLATHETSYAMCVGKLSEVLEKVLKAELIRQGWFLVKTHDLVKLVDELRTYDPELADSFQPLCEDLAERYFTDRYPGLDLEDDDWPALRSQIETIGHLLTAVASRISEPSTFNSSLPTTDHRHKGDDCHDEIHCG